MVEVMTEVWCGKDPELKLRPEGEKCPCGSGRGEHHERDEPFPNQHLICIPFGFLVFVQSVPILVCRAKDIWTICFDLQKSSSSLLKIYLVV